MSETGFIKWLREIRVDDVPRVGGKTASLGELYGELGAAGVRVLILFLGRTASPMQASVHEMEHRKYSPELLMQPEDVAAVVINALTLPRTAEVTEVSMRPCMKSY